MLVPARDALGHRRYSEQDLALAMGGRRAQAAGLSLAQVREFLAAGEPERAALLRDHRDGLAARMRELTEARDQVTGLLGSPPDPSCPYGV